MEATTTLQLTLTETAAQEVKKFVEAENLAFTAHTWSGALNTAASVHLLASSTHGLTMDFKPHESPMQHELVTDPWVQKDGFLNVRNTPGLGVTVVFLMLVQLTKAIGSKGLMPPDLAAWVPSAIFAFLGFVLLTRVRT